MTRFLPLKLGVLLMLTAVFPCTSFGKKGFTPSEMQSRFAGSLESSVSGVESANWSTPVDLWVQTSGASEGAAGRVAADVIAEAKKDLGQGFCVHVHNGDWKPLANLCWSYN